LAGIAPAVTAPLIASRTTSVSVSDPLKEYVAAAIPIPLAPAATTASDVASDVFATVLVPVHFVIFFLLGFVSNARLLPNFGVRISAAALIAQFADRRLQ
jgi:hypothetical protein